jgi:hypothetical protein
MRPLRCTTLKGLVPEQRHYRSVVATVALEAIKIRFQTSVDLSIKIRFRVLFKARHAKKQFIYERNVWPMKPILN